MSLFDFLSANPDVIGQVRVMNDDVEPGKLDELETKRRRARDYLREHNITVRPICRTLPEAT